MFPSCSVSINTRKRNGRLPAPRPALPRGCTCGLGLHRRSELQPQRGLFELLLRLRPALGGGIMLHLDVSRGSAAEWLWQKPKHHHVGWRGDLRPGHAQVPPLRQPHRTRLRGPRHVGVQLPDRSRCGGQRDGTVCVSRCGGAGAGPQRRPSRTVRLPSSISVTAQRRRFRTALTTPPPLLSTGVIKA